MCLVARQLLVMDFTNSVVIEWLDVDCSLRLS